VIPLGLPYPSAPAAKVHASHVARQKKSVTTKHDPCTSERWAASRSPGYLTPYSFCEVFGPSFVSESFVWSWRSARRPWAREEDSPRRKARRRNRPPPGWRYLPMTAISFWYPIGHIVTVCSKLNTRRYPNKCKVEPVGCIPSRPAQRCERDGRLVRMSSAARTVCL